MLKYLKDKYLLFDTNVLIAIRNNPPEKFEDFFKIIKENNCSLCINKFIQNEFLLGAKSLKSLQEGKDFLQNKFLNFSLTIEREEKLTEDAYELHRMYCTEASVNKNQISFTDCINGAFLLNKPNEVLMLTADLNDFPIKIFDRLDVFAIDLEKNGVITLGIYKLNEEKYKSKKKVIKNLK